jgi:hypothetical protein
MNNGGNRTHLEYMKWKQLTLYAAVAVLAGGCQNTSPTHSTSTNTHETPQASHVPQGFDVPDKRAPVPLLPRMAEHQRANMRDHLTAVQEIVAALSAQDFASVERSAARIGYSEQMGQMCAHMGAGAPGFTEMALNFHRTADTIGVAARQRDANAVLKAVATTVQTCVGCHATYRQKIVDEAAWKEITSRGRGTTPASPPNPKPR